MIHEFLSFQKLLHKFVPWWVCETRMVYLSVFSGRCKSVRRPYCWRSQVVVTFSSISLLRTLCFPYFCIIESPLYIYHFSSSLQPLHAMWLIKKYNLKIMVNFIIFLQLHYLLLESVMRIISRNREQISVPYNCHYYRI